MKTLYLVRHAEAAPGANDHDRALTAGGTAAATALGRWMAVEDAVPGLILSSDSRRTRQTVAALAAAFPPGVPIRFDPALYEASARELLEAIRAQDADAPDRLMVVGHNPAIGELVRLLGYRGKADAVARALRGHPPGGLAILRVLCHEWGDLWPGAAEMWRFILPDELPAHRAR